MPLKMTAPYYTKIDGNDEIKSAIKHIDNALDKSGIGESPPVTKIQAIRLEEARELLRKSLQEY